MDEILEETGMVFQGCRWARPQHARCSPQRVFCCRGTLHCHVDGHGVADYGRENEVSRKLPKRGLCACVFRVRPTPVGFANHRPNWAEIVVQIRPALVDRGPALATVGQHRQSRGQISQDLVEVGPNSAFFGRTQPTSARIQQMFADIFPCVNKSCRTLLDPLRAHERPNIVARYVQSGATDVTACGRGVAIILPPKCTMVRPHPSDGTRPDMGLRTAWWRWAGFVKWHASRDENKQLSTVLHWRDAAYREAMRALQWRSSDPTQRCVGTRKTGRPVTRREDPIHTVCNAFAGDFTPWQTLARTRLRGTLCSPTRCQNVARTGGGATWQMDDR